MIFDVVGNKIDLFQKEEIKEKEAREYAKSINAGFHLISCKDSVGIKDLFEDCCKRYLETNELVDSQTSKKDKDKIIIDNKSQKKVKKKKCC